MRRLIVAVVLLLAGNAWGADPVVLPVVIPQDSLVIVIPQFGIPAIPTLDRAYRAGGTITVNATDIIFNLTSTQDFIIQDNGTPIFTVLDSGTISIGGDVTMANGKWIGAGSGKGQIVFDDSNDEIEILNAQLGVGTSSPDTLGHFVSATSTELRLETSGASDPTLSFKTTNTANQINVFLDENLGNDRLVVQGMTAGVGTDFQVEAVTGQVATLRLRSGTVASTITQSATQLVLKHLLLDGDIIFQVNDGGSNTSALIIDGATTNISLPADNQQLEFGLATDYTIQWDNPNTDALHTITSGTFAFMGGNFGAGTASPNAPLEVKGALPGNVGGFPSGHFHVTGDGTAQFSNSVITGHSAYNTNTQLWYLGSMSSSNDNICFINRQDGDVHFYTNDTFRMVIDANGNVGIGLIPTANMAGLSIEAGLLTLKETTTPTADTNYAKLWTTSDNELFFQDGAGGNHLLHGDAFSNIWFHAAGTVEVAISTQNAFTKIDSFAVVGNEDDLAHLVGSAAANTLTLSSIADGEYEISFHASITATGGADKEMVIVLGITLAVPLDITNVTDDLVTPIVITSVAHGLENGDMVEIAGVLVNTAANGSFIVASKADDTFEIVALDGSATTGNGDYDEGTPTGNVTIEYPGNMVVHREVRGATLGAISATGLHVLAGSDVLALYVANLDGTTNLTVHAVSFDAFRIGD
ncbi:hypothetical protein LCGC14_0325720 [marine sediment metagenome]|uniref:Uncharacterized protein n=1 Tax=marine sediment metagenome TaxID=412755 RepID=A0A0F9W539_9ZZZZ